MKMLKHHHPARVYLMRELLLWRSFAAGTFDLVRVLVEKASGRYFIFDLRFAICGSASWRRYVTCDGLTSFSPVRKSHVIGNIVI